MSGSLTIGNILVPLPPTVGRNQPKFAPTAIFVHFFCCSRRWSRDIRPNIDLSSTFGINMKKKLIAEVRIRHDFDHIWSFSVKNSLLIGSGSWMWALAAL